MSSRSATPRLRYRPKRDGDGLTRALRLEMNLELLMICRSELGLESTELTLEEIGDVLGLNKERVRQIEAGAVTKMREARPTFLLNKQKQTRANQWTSSIADTQWP